jgi:hypothetical protein
VQSCAVRQAGLDCLHQAADDLRDAYLDFRGDLREIELPSSALRAADRVDNDATAIINVLADMAATAEPNEYDARSARLQRLLVDFDRHVVRLDERLTAAV